LAHAHMDAHAGQRQDEGHRPECKCKQPLLKRPMLSRQCLLMCSSWPGLKHMISTLDSQTHQTPAGRHQETAHCKGQSQPHPFPCQLDGVSLMATCEGTSLTPDPQLASDQTFATTMDRHHPHHCCSYKMLLAHQHSKAQAQPSHALSNPTWFRPAGKQTSLPEAPIKQPDHTYVASTLPVSRQVGYRTGCCSITNGA
jgi:hypothetical protein